MAVEIRPLAILFNLIAIVVLIIQNGEFYFTKDVAKWEGVGRQAGFLRQITRKEAGTIYKAIKDGEITAKPETTKALYGATDAYIRYADSRYSQDRLYYDLVYSATRHLLNGRTKEAQKDLKWWEDRNIDAATKKSPWYKYKK